MAHLTVLVCGLMKASSVKVMSFKVFRVFMMIHPYIVMITFLFQCGRSCDHRNAMIRVMWLGWFRMMGDSLYRVQRPKEKLIL